MTNYQRLLHETLALRTRQEPRPWRQAVDELQHELEREAREVLRVSEGVKWESER